MGDVVWEMLYGSVESDVNTQNTYKTTVEYSQEIKGIHGGEAPLLRQFDLMSYTNNESEARFV